MDRFHIETKNRVARLILKNQPLNTLDLMFLKQLTTRIHELSNMADDRRPRVLYLSSGIDSQFSHGIDPLAVLETDVAGREKIFFALGKLVEALWFGGIPVVADINGPAMAGGAVVACLADFAVIDRKRGKVSFSEVKVGLPIPEVIQTIIRCKVDPRSLNDVILLGRNYIGEDAVRVGLANASYIDAAERDELVEGYISRIVRLSPAVMKRTILEGRQNFRRQVEQFCTQPGEFSRFLSDEFIGRGLKAVVERRSPEF